MVLQLRIDYTNTPDYPDELPEMNIEVQEGSEGSADDSLSEQDIEMLLKRLRETVRPFTARSKPNPY